MKYAETTIQIFVLQSRHDKIVYNLPQRVGVCAKIEKVRCPRLCACWPFRPLCALPPIVNIFIHPYPICLQMTTTTMVSSRA